MVVKKKYCANIRSIPFVTKQCFLYIRNNVNSYFKILFRDVTRYWIYLLYIGVINISMYGYETILLTVKYSSITYLKQHTLYNSECEIAIRSSCKCSTSVERTNLIYFKIHFPEAIVDVIAHLVKLIRLTHIHN